MLLIIQLLDMGGGMADSPAAPAAPANPDRWLSLAGKLNVRISAWLLPLIVLDLVQRLTRALK